MIVPTFASEPLDKMINRLKEYGYIAKISKVSLVNEVDFAIFSAVCHSGSLNDWDENYWCMIEQLVLEVN